MREKTLLIQWVLPLVLGLLACEQRQASSTPPAQSAHVAPVAAPPASQPAGATQAATSALQLVEPSLVCMVNDQFMGKPQIPVTVEGKTYYGCCPMCKDRLANNRDVRSALDPVSRKSVDKATAVIGKTATGAVLYFENNDTFAAYGRQERL